MKWIKERVIGRSDTDQLGNDAMGREEREERRRGAQKGGGQARVLALPQSSSRTISPFPVLLSALGG